MSAFELDLRVIGIGVADLALQEVSPDATISFCTSTSGAFVSTTTMRPGGSRSRSFGITRPKRSTVAKANQYSPSCGALYWKRFLVGGGFDALPLARLTRRDELHVELKFLEFGLVTLVDADGKLNDNRLVYTLRGDGDCATANDAIAKPSGRPLPTASSS